MIKNLKFTIIIALITLCFVGCSSGVSIDDYNKIVAENAKYQDEIKAIKSENDAILKEKQVLSEELEKISKEKEALEILSTENNPINKLITDGYNRAAKISTADNVAKVFKDCLTKASWEEAAEGRGFNRKDEAMNIYGYYDIGINKLSVYSINIAETDFKNGKQGLDDFLSSFGEILDEENTSFNFSFAFFATIEKGAIVQVYISDEYTYESQKDFSAFAIQDDYINDVLNPKKWSDEGISFDGKIIGTSHKIYK